MLPERNNNNAKTTLKRERTIPRSTPVSKIPKSLPQRKTRGQEKAD